MSPPSFHLAALLQSSDYKYNVTTRATPSISSDEVLIKVTATAINPIDWKLPALLGDALQYPTVLGSDGAGEIVSVGDAVKNFEVGNRVFWQGILGQPDNCTFQQYCKMPAVLVGKTPDNVSDTEAASVSLTTMAAATALYDPTGHGLPLPWSAGGDQAGHGKAIIILGGSSSVGQYSIQLAKLSGFEKIVANCSPTHFDLLRSIGATAVLDRSTASPADYKLAVGGLLVEHVVDAISSNATQNLAIDILHEFEGGNVVTFLGPQSPVNIPNPNLQKPVELKSVVGLGSLPHLRYLSEPLFAAIGGEKGWLASGKLKPNKVDVVPGGLHSAEKAVEMNKQGLSGIKKVIQPSKSV